MSVFYDVISFPYEGHWLVDLRDAPVALHLALSEGVPLGPLPESVDVEIVEAGKPMDFSFTPMGIPVVSSRAAVVLDRVWAADVQLIRARIPDVTAQYWLVNVRTRLECLPGPQEMMRVPAPGGGFLGVPRYRIDPALAAGRAIFRLAHRPADLLLSDALVEAIRRENLVGPAVHSVDGAYDDILMPGLRQSDDQQEDS
jgi:hypothetical protein